MELIALFVKETIRRAVHEDSRRVCVDFSSHFYETVLAMKHLTGSPTTSAVLRDALRVYIWMLNQHQQGFQVGAFKETDEQITIREITLPLEMAL